jgi:endoglucanase
MVLFMVKIRRPLRGVVLSLLLTAATVGCDALPTGVALPADGGTAESGASLLPGASLYRDPNTAAARQAQEWRTSRPGDAAQMDKIAMQPQAVWLGDWSGDIRSASARLVEAAAAAGGVPVLVAYNIPDRDCGGLSGGGGATADAYRRWIGELAAGIGGHRAVVILEPDALAAMDCLSPADRSARIELLRFATATLKQGQRTAVYIDAGHPRWHTAATMAERLSAAGIADADGFSLNVSNFIGDAENESYGSEISGLTGRKTFVIDSGRNGAAAAEPVDWCNPEGQALGRRPTTRPGNPLVDAYLWIKRPGESDGACNGAPAAGQWWAEYALGLARRASY